MKKFFNCLGGMLVFFCLLGSCSMLGFEQEHSSVTEETSPKEKEKEKEKETVLDEETIPEETIPDEKTPNENENPDGTKTKDETLDETQDDPEEIPLPPTFIQFKTLPQNEVVFEFSGPVSFVSLRLDPDLGFEMIEEGGSEIVIKLTGDLVPGLSVEADLLVIDEYENFINEQVSFTPRNNRVPRLQINELYTEYSKPKVEFIELKMLSSGNLYALRVFAAGNNKAPLIYEFEPVEVLEGDYVVIHLRKPEASCVDEYDLLNESGGTFSSPTARDFWISGTNKLLHKTDAVYVLDQDDKILDAVMLSESPSASWDKSYFTEAANFLLSQDAWKSPAGAASSPADAVDTSGIKTATTKSISRNEGADNTHTAADWYITTQGVTPGLPNKL